MPVTYTTTELAIKFGVKGRTVTQVKSCYGHYKGYEPIGRVPGKRILIWEFKGL